MTNYKISGFDAKTPQPKQDKLKTGLASVAGVEQVKLNPQRGEVSISCGSKQEAKPEQIKAAVTKAGFSLMEAGAKKA